MVQSTRSRKEVGVPTILVTGNDNGIEFLVKRLRSGGYLVLVAANFDDAVGIVRIHSRQIHVLVAYGSVNARDTSDLAAMMTVLRLGVVPLVRVNGQRDAMSALSEIRKVFALLEATS